MALGPAKHNANESAKKLAEHLGWNPSTAYDYAKVAEFWTDEQQFRDAVMGEDKSLSWSHVVELTREVDADRRQSLMIQALNEGWSVERLAKERKASPAEEADPSTPKSAPALDLTTVAESAFGQLAELKSTWDEDLPRQIEKARSDELPTALNKLSQIRRDLDSFYQAAVLRPGGDPGLDRRAAPGTVDQAQPHIEFLVQPLAEVVQHGREEGHILRRADLPGRASRRGRCRPVLDLGAVEHHDVLGRLRCLHLFDMQQADLRAVGGGHRLLASRAPPQAELHVGLARADPHFADEDVVQLDLVFAADGYAVGLAIGLHGREHDFPVALGSGRGIVELNRNIFTGIGPAPDR